MTNPVTGGHYVYGVEAVMKSGTAIQLDRLERTTESYGDLTNADALRAARALLERDGDHYVYGDQMFLVSEFRALRVTLIGATNLALSEPVEELQP